jgi:hypothetical protein
LEGWGSTIELHPHLLKSKRKTEMYRADSRF